MKHKKKLLISLLVVLLVMTGCSKQLTDKDKKAVTNPETGQRLTENIICQPENATVVKLYEKNNVDLSKLPKCSQISVTTGGYEGLWTTIFVKPLAWILVKTEKIVKNYGLAIILVTIIIRIILVPFTARTAKQSESLKLAQGDLSKLEKKYANKTDQESMMRKSQEMMMIYKKYNIKPLSGCLFSLIQIPLFFAFYEAMYRLPVIYEDALGPLKLGITPMYAIMHGGWYYFIIPVLVAATTYFSFKLNQGAVSQEGEQAKTMKMVMNISIIMIIITSFSIPCGIALYWIFNSGFTIVQNLIVKITNKTDLSRRK